MQAQLLSVAGREGQAGAVTQRREVGVGAFELLGEHRHEVGGAHEEPQPDVVERALRRHAELAGQVRGRQALYLDEVARASRPGASGRRGFLDLGSPGEPGRS
jgi:hypothetical protein